MRILCFIFLSMLFVNCRKPVFKSKWTNETSPENFTARFETSKGNFDILVTREWSAKAADRFYQLLKHHYYDNAIFYRVVPGFVAQFGNSDTIKMRNWEKFKVPDEQVIHGNEKGTLSFARGDKETRGTELFINFNDNQFLDTLNYAGVKGFPAFGKVTKGMESVDSIYSGYEEATMKKMDTFYINRSQFLNSFPKLDVIRRAYILRSE